MRKIVQIAVTEIQHDHKAHESVRQNIYALCQDGTLWRDCTVDGVNMGWTFLEGPPEGEPGKKEPTLEEQAELINESGGSQTFVGSGHPLSAEAGDET